MIGLWSAHAREFLWGLGLVTTPAFAVPIAFAPLTWARLMMWRLPAERDLTVYFGRCLGAFILVVEFLIFRAAWSGEGLEILFEALTGVWLTMALIHIVGACEGSQPITETLEIGLWVVLLALTALCWPVSV